MDPQREKRHQAFRVILVDSLMTLAAISVVIILVLVVSGYWINENFEVSRSGMLQINSSPIGATVSIDDEQLSQRTSTSRVIPAGEHTVKIEKDGYSSWSKTVEIKDGLLYRLHYPQLFSLERVAEEIPLKFDIARISVSPRQDLALLIANLSKWSLVNLEDDEVKPREFDLSSILAGESEILSIEWNNDQNRVLVNTRSSVEKNSWFLIDLQNIDRSINLTNEFGTGFSKISILNNSADSLLALKDKNLQRININNRSVSAILVEGVEKYYSYGNDIVFTAKDKDEKGYIGLLHKDEVKVLSEIENVDADVFLSKFYDNEYLTVVNGKQVEVFKRDNLEEATLSYQLSFEPVKVKMERLGGFVVMNNDTVMATLDMESEKLSEWSIENAKFGWLDGDTIYVVVDDELVVYDFDGLNRIVVTKNVDSNYPAVIAGNKWLYYIKDNKLIREAL